jgi:hypothetical protein
MVSIAAFWDWRPEWAANQAFKTINSACSRESYQLPITIKRAMISVNPAIASSDAAIRKNNLELVARSGLFLERTVARMANEIPAAANNVGQIGLRWLAISRLAKLKRLRSLLLPAASVLERE